MRGIRKKTEYAFLIPTPHLVLVHSSSLPSPILFLLRVNWCYLSAGGYTNLFALELVQAALTAYYFSLSRSFHFNLSTRGRKITCENHQRDYIVSQYVLLRINVSCNAKQSAINNSSA